MYIIGSVIILLLVIMVVFWRKSLRRRRDQTVVKGMRAAFRQAGEHYELRQPIVEQAFRATSSAEVRECLGKLHALEQNESVTIYEKDNIQSHLNDVLEREAIEAFLAKRISAADKARQLIDSRRCRTSANADLVVDALTAIIVKDLLPRAADGDVEAIDVYKLLVRRVRSRAIITQ